MWLFWAASYCLAQLALWRVSNLLPAFQVVADEVAPLERDRLFIALTRPQMFAGVTYSFFVINAVLAAELFLIFKTKEN